MADDMRDAFGVLVAARPEPSLVGFLLMQAAQHDQFSEHAEQKAASDFHKRQAYFLRQDAAEVEARQNATDEYRRPPVGPREMMRRWGIAPHHEQENAA